MRNFVNPTLRLQSPPTYEDVYLHFRFLLQEEGNTGLPAIREKAEICANTVTKWWARTGIKIIATCSIIEKIQKLHKEYQSLYRHRAKGTDTAKKNRDAFCNVLATTFLVAKKNQTLCDEDRQFLENMSQPSRIGSLGSVDTRTEKSNKNKELRDLEEQKRIEM